MSDAKSFSGVTSPAPSSPTRSPKRPAYFVQSPSRDSRDDCDKSSGATPAYSSPVDSPSRHSTVASSASRVSGMFWSRKMSSRKRNEKGWPECNVIEEEGDYDDMFGDGGLTRRRQCLIAVLGSLSLFTLFCLIIWGASRPYGPQIAVRSVTVNNFYFGVGSDYSGVPTKMLTVNCSVKMMTYNPAPFFGIHVRSTHVDLFYSQIAVATGEMKKYYQPRKSQRVVSVKLEGNKVPLYGAGASIGGGSVEVPLRLELGIQSQGNVVGKLVKTKHQRHVSCSLVINSGAYNTKPFEFKEDSCTYG